MQLTLEIPDALAEQITAAGKDPARVALEALLVDGYRRGTLHEGDIRYALDFSTPMQVHELLAQHDVPLHFAPDYVEQELATLVRIGAIRKNIAA